MKLIFGNTNDGHFVYLDIMIFLAETRDDKRGGGEGLFVKENINYIIREDLKVFILHILSEFERNTQYETKGKSNEIIGVINKPNTQPRADFDVFTTIVFELVEIINQIVYNIGCLGILI